MAKARELIGGGVYDPETVKMIGDAFESAWANVSENYESKLAIEAARLKLANIVMSLVGEGERNPDRLKDLAVRILSVDNT